MSESIIANSFTQAVTQNHFDEGKKYYYRINADNLQCKIGSGEWEWVPGPYYRCRIKNVAADNNRVFILTAQNELYWRCLKEDSASWVIFLLTVLEILGAGIGDEFAWLLIGDNFKIEGERYPDLSTFANAYRTWVLETHDTRWNRLDRGINGDDIIDIAVGHWNNTVVTYYALMKSGRVMYLDEEPLMQEWAEVRGSNRPSFNQNSRICASHSVVAATKGEKIYWIRIDAHNPDHWPFGPFNFNWTEVWHDLPFHERENHPGWHSVEAPTSGIDEFFIDVGCGAPWPVPKPNPNPLSLTIHGLVAGISEEIDEIRGTHSEVGFLGDMRPSLPRYNYPFCCVIKQSSDGKYKHLLVPRSAEREIEFAQWEDVDLNLCIGYVANTNTKELHLSLCRWGKKIHLSNRTMYDTIEDALADGYNGCYYCLREYHTD
ncbi:MAG: hypothetical protein AB1711_10080 [Thermodesulfobacteriota bacterium]